MPEVSSKRGVQGYLRELLFRWKYSTVNVKSLFFIGKTLCDMCSDILVVLLSLLVAGSCDALKSCDVVLDRRNYKSAGTWDKLKMCNLHKYNHFDFVECLNQLDKKSLKKMLHVQFFGDSRIRQQFMSFVEVLV